MKETNKKDSYTPADNSRRAFIKNGAKLTALATAGSLAGISPLDVLAGAGKAADSMMHGIQIGAVFICR